VEAVLAVAVLVTALLGHVNTGTVVVLGVTLVVLVVQLAVVRPRLNRRSDAVLAGDDSGPRSHAHVAYLALECVKVVGLLAFGILALS
jgi:hypothetical protein